MNLLELNYHHLPLIVPFRNEMKMISMHVTVLTCYPSSLRLEG
ncbi:MULTISPECIES: hypothetical protein [Bacillus cereus group]|nr:MULTISPECIES: hypothetical protein [Bacillus cereus group]